MRRQAAEQAQQVLAVSERRVCWVLGQPRSTQRYDKGIPDDEEILRTRIIALVSWHGTNEQHSARPVDGAQEEQVA